MESDVIFVGETVPAEVKLGSKHVYFVLDRNTVRALGLDERGVSGVVLRFEESMLKVSFNVYASIRFDRNGRAWINVPVVYLERTISYHLWKLIFEHKVAVVHILHLLRSE